MKKLLLAAAVAVCVLTSGCDGGHGGGHWHFQPHWGHWGPR